MAKSRHSGGYCETVVSDGSATELTVSEEEDTRKCVTLINSGRRGAYGVPMQLVPLSKLSAFQRKQVANRFKSELERVRLFQKKFQMQKRNGVTLSSSSDININRGQIDNLRKPSISASVQGNQVKPFIETSRKQSISSSVQGNTLKTSIETSRKSVPGNKLKPLGQIQKPRGWNRGTCGKFETQARTCLPGTANSLLMKDCESLLKLLMKHKFGWVFNAPVDVVKLNIPDYFSVITHPMDLGTVQNKIAKGSYTGPLEFAADVRLTFSNAKYFETRWKTLQKKIPRNDSPPLPSKTNTSEDVQTSRPMPPSKKRKIASLPHQPKIIPPPQPQVIPPAKLVMSNQERQNIGKELESFEGVIPAYIIDFLKEHSSNGKEGEEDEIEIDIDEFSDDAMFKLRKLLDYSLLEKKKIKVKDEACEIELLNDSGPSNSSLQAFKGNDPADEEVNIIGNEADEEVDICGIESPVTSHPPVVIEKDTTYQTSKCSSPGSSDSDSSGSSDSESDDEAIPQDLSKVPEIISTGAQMDLKTTAAHTSEINRECGASERQISPDKLIRAALIKNRFVDTILNAREKTLTQGVKGDPEKMRLDKEKLEMERRKEKARLQAEAKAAEEARKRAEEEAAAESRRKRELERQAARQALLQMEKTVEINENSQFLEDLEMLRVVPAEQLPCSVDETSPDDSQNGMGSFKFGGSNPLEQLGLYIKVEDEEEEGDPLCVPNPVNDVEEGEID
ncbi:putative chromatin remodeler Bromodomain family [Medicago truncatula]|uniref:Putative chromatin remodeler Bromodomain family n=1 Tax=Medicago truncatula TaxID=3880 RepID=A0A396H369_MEDTR|nr:putative chromatin remodeler Bromodomain family [Medicago truncatula]